MSANAHLRAFRSLWQRSCMTDEETYVLQNLVACRDLLAFTVSDQWTPTDEIQTPMIALHQLLVGRIEAAKLRGFAEAEVAWLGNRLPTDPD